MPLRNAHNPHRKVSTFEKKVDKGNNMQNADTKLSKIAGVCRSCGTEVPFKPGFRPSSLQCPKCGKTLGTK